MKTIHSISLLCIGVVATLAACSQPETPQAQTQAVPKGKLTAKIVAGVNGKIAFASERDGNREIYVMNADGSNQTRLTNHLAVDDEPKWSPDGSKIAFHSRRDGNDEVYVMNADGSSQTNLTNNLDLDLDPSWSPDGSKIAFAGARGGLTGIYVMNADGSSQTRLSPVGEVDFHTAWSPDGSKIAFVTPAYDVFVMNADGSGRTRLTNDPAIDYLPSWNPDGSKIAFTSQRDSHSQIYLMNPDGSNQTRLTDNTANEFLSAWSPDGSKIAFQRDTSPQPFYEIYVMNADGSNPIRLTNNPGVDNAGPDWQPLPDTTAPTAAPSQSPAANGTGWNNTDVTVTWNWTDNAGGSGIDPANCTTSSTSSDEGNLTLNASCKDKAGNTGSASLSLKVDKTAPTLNPVVTPNPVVLNGSATVTPNAADALSGLASQSCTALNTSSIGTKTVTCTATDNAGNSSNKSLAYNVIYNFSGFFQPVSNPPVLNNKKAGSEIVLKFSLGGRFGRGVLIAANSRQIDCGTLAPIGSASPIKKGELEFDDGKYKLEVKTDKVWRGSCRQVVLTLSDGTPHAANFKFN